MRRVNKQSPESITRDSGFRKFVPITKDPPPEPYRRNYTPDPRVPKNIKQVGNK